MSVDVLSAPPAVRPIRRRTRRDPKPRYRPDLSDQLDIVYGCPALQVPEGHIARALKKLIAELDLSEVDHDYSSLGRHGYDPRHVLGAWVLASLQGLHHATKVSEALKLDAALRFIAGGHSISAGVLKRFRACSELFEDLLQQTLTLAVKRGLIKLDELAVDSVRLRAHASMGAVRTRERSQKRLESLKLVQRDTLTDEARQVHDEKVRKHQEAIQACTERECTSIVVTNPGAALMKFPNGGYGPGQRVTVAAAGVKERFVVTALIDAATTDYGKLEAAVKRTRRALEQSGIPVGERLQVAADAGYFCETDLVFAQSVRHDTDVLVPEPPQHKNRGHIKGLFNRDCFHFTPDGPVLCPAGRPMLGPVKDGRGELRWTGQGCENCPLRSSCTKGKQRVLVMNPRFDEARSDMRTRMAQPEARQRYNQRIATIEPVFSILEERMAYRRVSTRHERNSRAEILLKLLSYNLVRLIKASARFFCVRLLLCEEPTVGWFLLPFGA